MPESLFGLVKPGDAEAVIEFLATEALSKVGGVSSSTHSSASLQGEFSCQVRCKGSL